MTDYIKREDAVRRIAILIAAEAESDGCEDQPMDTYIEYASEDLADIPSADVAPVRHAKWEGCKGDITCSACGEYALFDSEDIEMQYRTIYCPFCGAKMDEGGTDGTDDC